MSPGILVIDNNCYARLSDPDALRRFRANLRAANWIAQPSEVNLLESSAAPPDVRARLLRTIRAVADGQPLLPWPIKLLKQIGQAMTRGEFRFTVPPSGAEWYLDDPAAVEEVGTEALQFQRDIELAFSQLHQRNRQRVQAQLRQQRARDEFGSARDFLERGWAQTGGRRMYAEVTWKALALPGKPPLDAIEANEAWRLLLDAEGVAAYERAIAHEQPKFVQRMDLVQLVYLALADRRMLVTADAPLRRAADAVLIGRYPDARTVHVADLTA